MRGVYKQELHASINVKIKYNHHRKDKSNLVKQNYAKGWFEILENEVWTIHQVLVVTFANVGNLVLTLETSIATTQRRFWKVLVMPYFSETSNSFFWVCGHSIVHKFNKGNLVFADVLITLPPLKYNQYIQSWIQLHLPVNLLPPDYPMSDKPPTVFNDYSGCIIYFVQLWLSTCMSVFSS